MRRSTLRLYRRKVSSMDKWGKKDNFQFSIFNFQFKKLSIELASFWWALSGGTKWSGRSVAVWAKRVCGAHSETKRRSSSADAALNFWFFSFKRKERTITWVKPKVRTRFGLSQKYGYDLNFWFFSFKRKEQTITWVKRKERIRTDTMTF